jgi:N-acetylmuramoyl-L-alanine amidase
VNRLAIACNTANYGGLRAKKVKYIVVHYTAGNGDTARDNGIYFQRNAGLNASAHWFVDQTTAVASVPEQFVAWHCGGAVYSHPDCRNANSIGIELCSRKDGDGNYYFLPETVDNAVELIRELMEKYSVPPERVIRHYDVTGKICPAPFVGTGIEDWKEFKEEIAMKRYNTVQELPAWARPTVQKLIDKGFLNGTDTGLDLTHDNVRMLVILDRAGVFGE